MLTAVRPSRGFSIIELLVAMALIGILMAAAIPGLGNWMADTRLRAAAEALTNQVRLAQATAVAQNRVSVLVLTSGTPAYNSAPTASGTGMMVVVDPLSSETLSSASMVSSSTEARQHGVAVAGPAMLCFNSLGQQTVNLTTALSSSVTCVGRGSDDSAASFTTSTCSAGTTACYELTRPGSPRKYRVVVYTGGRVRMCDALKTLSTTDPDGCP